MDFSFTFKKKPDGPGGPPPASAAQEQYDQLRACGLNLAGHSQVKDAAAGQATESFTQAPFAFLLALMGGFNAAGEPWSNDVWLFVPNEEDGGVNDLLTHLPRLSKGAFALDGAEVAPNEETGAPVLNLAIAGEAAAYELSGESELAPQVISTLAALIAERGEGARLAMTNLEGMGTVFVYLNEQELGELAEATGLEWGWVE